MEVTQSHAATSTAGLQQVRIPQSRPSSVLRVCGIPNGAAQLGAHAGQGSGLGFGSASHLQQCHSCLLCGEINETADFCILRAG